MFKISNDLDKVKYLLLDENQLDLFSMMRKKTIEEHLKIIESTNIQNDFSLLEKDLHQKFGDNNISQKILKFFGKW